MLSFVTEAIHINRIQENLEYSDVLVYNLKI